MLKVPNLRAAAERPRLGLALVLAAALVSLVALAVSAQAEILPENTPADAAESTVRIKTHTNAGLPGVTTPFSIPCNGCHMTHKAENTKLLQAEGAAICARCHDLNSIHQDPATRESVSAWPVPADCLSCHPHSSGFMPVSGAVSLALSARAVGYDDLDRDGNLSPGDRVHYRIDYGNLGPEEVTGVLLRDEVDTAHVASISAITGGGSFDGTAIQWNIGTLAAGASGSVTYDAVLQGAAAFEGDTAAPAAGSSPAAEGTATTDNAATTEDSASTTDNASTTGIASASEGASTAGNSGTTQSLTTTTTVTTESPAAPSTTDGSTPATTATITSAASTDVVNTVVLTADNRGPASTTVVVSVVVGGAPSTTSTVVPRKWRTTTTERPTTTSTTIVTGPNDVLNTAVLAAQDREPISTWVVVSVAVDEDPPADLPPSATSDEPGSAPESSAESSTVTMGGQEAGHENFDEDGHVGPREDMHFRVHEGEDDGEDLTLSKKVEGYDDLDKDGKLSPGDRLHYRIDYANLGPHKVAEVLLRDELDEAHVAAVEAITGGGTFDKTAFEIQWSIGLLAAKATGTVTYDVVLKDDPAFGGGATTLSKTAAPEGESPASGEESATSESPTAMEGLETPESPTWPTTATTEPAATTSGDSSPTDSASTTAGSAEPGLVTTGVPLAALAVFPVAGAAYRRFFSRKKVRSRRMKEPKRQE